MLDIARIALILGLILFLLRKGVKIGYVMLISALAVVIFYGMDASGMVHAAKKAATERISIMLLLSLSLIRIFELVLREQKILSQMMGTIKGSFRFRKAVMISMPVLMGMLPSLGGAYFSAPMVREATEGTGMGNEEKAFINYWFRHPWEYILPLYPGIVFAAAVSGIGLNRLIIANISCAAMMIGAGFLFSMRGAGSAVSPGQCDHEPSTGGSRAWLNFLPIAVVLALVIAFHVELHYALLVVLIPLFVYYRYGPARIIQAIRYGFSYEVVVMVAGIMLFKETMEVSGAVASSSDIFITHGVPVVPVFCALPFIAGILTGHTVGFVGSTFPLLVTISGKASLPLISLAFAAGFIGVLLSPVHLCLILTREYFSAGLPGIYRKTIPASLMILAVAFAQYLIVR
jgi:integral membrane protein (TIGR00529 family)